MNVPGTQLEVEIMLPIFHRLRGSVGQVFIRFIFHARIRRDPIDFPALASIFGERLLEPARIWSNVRPDISHQNGSTIKFFQIEKLTTAIPEFADCRLAQAAAIAVCKI